MQWDDTPVLNPCLWMSICNIYCLLVLGAIHLEAVHPSVYIMFEELCNLPVSGVFISWSVNILLLAAAFPKPENFPFKPSTCTQNCNCYFFFSSFEHHTIVHYSEIATSNDLDLFWQISICRFPYKFDIEIFSNKTSSVIY